MSSYKYNNFKELFEIICFIKQPKFIVEFGILNGYSLDIWLNQKCKVLACDIFEKFNGNHASRDIIKKYKYYDNLEIKDIDFYNSCNMFEDNTIDIIHIDIANNGLTYKYAVENYMSKLTKNGIMILEGGSSERDNVEWMKKYNKPSIKEYLKTLNIKYKVFKKFPSCTIILKS